MIKKCGGIAIKMQLHACLRIAPSGFKVARLISAPKLSACNRSTAVAAAVSTTAVHACSKYSLKYNRRQAAVVQPNRSVLFEAAHLYG